MGYESRVYVISPYYTGSRSAEIIARFNLSCCGPNFADIFTETCPYKIIKEDSEEEENPYVEEDKYGASLKMATAEEVMGFIKQDKEAMDYRRTRDFYEFLKSSIKHYDELFVVHYGY